MTATFQEYSIEAGRNVPRIVRNVILVVHVPKDVVPARLVLQIDRSGEVWTEIFYPKSAVVIQEDTPTIRR